MKHIVVEDFFTNFDAIKEEFKKIPMFNCKEHPELVNSNLNISWPGKRSEDLKFSNKFFTGLFLNEFRNKFNNFFESHYDFKIQTHLRVEEDNKGEFIHKDSPDADYSMLVYLSQTNLASGTSLYDHNDKLITDVKFIQNRALIFDSRYSHAAINNHGTGIEDGRLTLNIFWKERQ